MPSLKSLVQHAHSDHQDFHPPLIRLQHSAPHPQGRRVLWAILALVAFLIVWALLGRLDIVAVADGRLTLDVEGEQRTVPLPQIDKAQVKLELNRSLDDEQE